MNAANLLHDVTYISGYVSGQSADVNVEQHGMLRWSLDMAGVEVVRTCLGCYEGVCEETYMVIGDYEVLLSISRSYGQTTLLHRGVLYDVGTGAAICRYTGVDVYIGVPTADAWTKVGDVYVVFKK